jgi:hypothetical protein
VPVGGARGTTGGLLLNKRDVRLVPFTGTCCSCLPGPSTLCGKGKPLLHPVARSPVHCLAKSFPFFTSWPNLYPLHGLELKEIIPSHCLAESCNGVEAKNELQDEED